MIPIMGYLDHIKSPINNWDNGKISLSYYVSGFAISS